MTDHSNTKYAVIVAGGKGQRMQSDLPKQFLLLDGLPALMHTLKAFYDFDAAIELILVLPESQIEYWEFLCEEFEFPIYHKIIAGGKTRFHSVKNGLSLIEGKGIVAIHDGVRPLVSQATLKNCFETARIKGNALPVVDVVDSLRMVIGEDNKAVDRSQFKQVQTPQVFQTKQIKKAFLQKYTPLFTDDASVSEKDGNKIHLVSGNVENVKITTPLDLKLAELYLGQQ